jgi:hypothetical protein
MNRIPFTPTGFETVYGFEPLDTLHNFFPEMMYDDTLFNQEWMAWMRSRTQSLFPSFVREQNKYNIYHSAQRRAEYEAWRSVYNVNPHYNPNRIYETPPRRAAAATAPHAPSRGGAMFGARRATQRRTAGNEGIFSSFLNENIPVVTYATTIDAAADADLLNPMLTLLRAALQVDTGVTVPTAEQLATGTTVQAPPENTECTICQETSSANDLAWRRIHRCGHMFHDTCIQPWFRTNNTCPTCRGQL